MVLFQIPGHSDGRAEKDLEKSHLWLNKAKKQIYNKIKKMRVRKKFSEIFIQATNFVKKIRYIHILIYKILTGVVGVRP